MRTNYRHFLILPLLLMSFAVLASSAQAQWRIDRVQNDAAGHLSFLRESNAFGDIRVSTYSYIPGTNIVGLERVTTKKADRTISIITERRDQFNRTTFISNEYLNAAGNMVRGFRQRWRYSDPRDTRGLQTRQQYDPMRGWRAA